MTRSTFTVFVILATGVAAPAFAQEDARGFIDINVIGLQSAQGDHTQTYTYAAPLFSEVAAFAAVYPGLPRVIGSDFSGGTVFSHGFGLQVHAEQQTYKSPVGLGALIPSPYFFNTDGIAGNVTDVSLQRRDLALDMSASYTLPVSDRLRVRFFGGPTYFHLKNQMVSNIGYSQFASRLVRVNLVNIDSFDSEEVSASALGYHIGADVSVFFSRHVGVGGVVRLNRGTVTVQEPFSGRDADLKMGHAGVGAGLRLRF